MNRAIAKHVAKMVVDLMNQSSGQTVTKATSVFENGTEVTITIAPTDRPIHRKLLTAIKGQNYKQN